MAVLIPALWKRGFLPKLTLKVNNPDIKRVLLNMLPGIAGLGLLQVTTVVNMRFASQLGEGPISWINWADRLLELPLSLVSVSLGTALLPTLSGLWAQGDKRQMSDTMNFSLRLNLFVCVAAAAGLYALAYPIVEVIFQRGQFTAADTEATAGVVRIWAMIMIPTACVRVLAPAYYAVKNTWFPAVVSGIALVVHLIAAPLLMAQWGLTGLNLSSLVSSSLNFLLLLLFFQILIAEFSHGKMLWHFVKFLVPAAALVGAVQIHPLLIEVLGDSYLMKLLALTVSVVAGGVAYALVSRVMGLEEWNATAERLVTRLRAKLGRKA
jgi:putative peptidoglycan lipid II flippase